MKEQNNIIHILLIDDDADDRHFFQQALLQVSAHAILDWASNGEAGLDKLVSAIILPDYVFLDLNMPRMSGLQVLKRIKETVYLKDVPVIICSTAQNPSNLAELLSLGAMAYLTKPSTMQDMVSLIRGIVDGGNRT